MTQFFSKKTQNTDRFKPWALATEADEECVDCGNPIPPVPCCEIDKVQYVTSHTFSELTIASIAIVGTDIHVETNPFDVIGSQSPAFVSVYSIILKNDGSELVTATAFTQTIPAQSFDIPIDLAENNYVFFFEVTILANGIYLQAKYGVLVNIDTAIQSEFFYYPSMEIIKKNCCMTTVALTEQTPFDWEGFSFPFGIEDTPENIFAFEFFGNIPHDCTVRVHFADGEILIEDYFPGPTKFLGFSALSVIMSIDNCCEHPIAFLIIGANCCQEQPYEIWCEQDIPTIGVNFGIVYGLADTDTSYIEISADQITWAIIPRPFPFNTINFTAIGGLIKIPWDQGLYPGGSTLYYRIRSLAEGVIYESDLTLPTVCCTQKFELDSWGQSCVDGVLTLQVCFAWSELITPNEIVLQISDDGGFSWAVIDNWGNIPVSGLPVCNDYDVSAYQGQNILLRFWDEMNDCFSTTDSDTGFAFSFNLQECVAPTSITLNSLALNGCFGAVQRFMPNVEWVNNNLGDEFELQWSADAIMWFSINSVIIGSDSSVAIIQTYDAIAPIAAALVSFRIINVTDGVTISNVVVGSIFNCP